MNPYKLETLDIPNTHQWREVLWPLKLKKYMQFFLNITVDIKIFKEKGKRERENKNLKRGKQKKTKVFKTIIKHNFALVIVISILLSLLLPLHINN